MKNQEIHDSGNSNSWSEKSKHDMHMNSIHILEFISLYILLPIRGRGSRYEKRSAVAVDNESGLTALKCIRAKLG